MPRPDLDELIAQILYTSSEPEALEATQQWLKINQKKPKFSYYSRPMTILTPLMAAIRKNYFSLLQYLVETVHFPIDEKNSDGRTALHFAILEKEEGEEEKKKESLALYLVDKTQDFSPDALSNTPLHASVEKNFCAVTEKLLIKTGPLLINAVTLSLNTPLHIAAEYGYDLQIALLCQHGANPNHYNLQGVTPLDLAVITGKASSVVYLLEKGNACSVFNNPIARAACSITAMIDRQRNIMSEKTKSIIFDALLMAGSGLSDLPDELYEHYQYEKKLDDDFVIMGEHTPSGGEPYKKIFSSIKTLLLALQNPSWHFNRVGLANACRHFAVDPTFATPILDALKVDIASLPTPPKTYPLEPLCFPPTLLDNTVLQSLTCRQLHYIIPRRCYLFSRTVEELTLFMMNHSERGFYMLLKSREHFIFLIDRLLSSFTHVLAFSKKENPAHAEEILSLTTPCAVQLFDMYNKIFTFCNQKKNPIFILKASKQFHRHLDNIIIYTRAALSKHFPSIYAIIEKLYVMHLVQIARAHILNHEYNSALQYAELANAQLTAPSLEKEFSQETFYLVRQIAAHACLELGRLHMSKEYLQSVLCNEISSSFLVELVMPLSRRISAAFIEENKHEDALLLLQSIKKILLSFPLLRSQHTTLDFCHVVESYEKEYFHKKVSIFKKDTFDLLDSRFPKIQLSNNGQSIILQYNPCALATPENANTFSAILKKHSAIICDHHAHTLTIATTFVISPHFDHFLKKIKLISYSSSVAADPHTLPIANTPPSVCVSALEHPLSALTLAPTTPRKKIKTRKKPNRSKMEKQPLPDPTPTEKNYGFPQYEGFTQAFPIHFRFPAGLYFISLSQEKKFLPFHQLIKSGSIAGLAPFDRGSAGVKIVTAQDTLLARLKLLGKNGHLRASGTVKTTMLSSIGETQSLFLIDRIATKDSEKRKY